MISSGWYTKKDLDEIAEEGCKEISGRIFRAAVSFSPVFTGAFRASWRIAFNEPRYDVTAGRTPFDSIRGAAFRWPSGFKLGDDIIISNNQPYADRVEYFGWPGVPPYAPLRLALTVVK
jgi:hypothetical protein